MWSGQCIQFPKCLSLDFNYIAGIHIIPEVSSDKSMWSLVMCSGGVRVSELSVRELLVSSDVT